MNEAASGRTLNRGFTPETRKAFVESDVPAALPPSARWSPDFPSPDQIAGPKIATGRRAKL
jgi:hypothetical protein